ncbi:MAG: Ammonium transporter 2 er [Actinomycetia bacterium]|nr:Ammonium transporter 2 er [Actinomycetes bacterium]
MIPYPSWLNAGDNAWQLVAATLVGLMSLPGLAVLYGGLVQKKWAVNTMLMAFSGFSLVLVVWVLWAYKMGFGDAWVSPFKLASKPFQFIGKPGPVLGHAQEQGQAQIPNLVGGMPDFRFPKSTLVYFQFVFAAITPLLFLGSLIGRMNFKAWIIFVPVWSTLVYSVNAFLIWGGGWWAGQGALDYSGGYVIHLAAGTTGFVAAAVVGPRLARDRSHGVPNNLLLVAVGAGLLWLGWNGFNGGDPYFAGADAASAVLNTNLATAVALLTWMLLDMFVLPAKKATFLGAVNGMIVGLVAITPAAGYVNGLGAMAIGLIASTVVWAAWNFLSRVSLFKRVDDSLGVVYTHGIAGLTGGLLVGMFADPKMIVYLGSPDGKTPGFSAAGWFYGNFKQLYIQAGAALTVIVYSALMTFIILRVMKLFMSLRMTEAELEIGDVAVHEEEVMPSETLVRVGTGTTAPVEAAAPQAGEPASVGEPAKEE